MDWNVIVIEKPIATPPHFWSFALESVSQMCRNFNLIGFVHYGALRKVLIVNYDLHIESILVSFLGRMSEVGLFHTQRPSFAHVYA